LGYDFGDSLDQSLAERIVVNARDAGINVVAKAIPATRIATVMPMAAAKPGVDVQLLHWRMPSVSPGASLDQLLAALGPLSGTDAAPLPDAASPEQIYERERTVVGSFRIIPLVWLPQVYWLNARVKDWKPPAPGQAWPLADVWLDAPAGSAGVQ
jgi:hypothetical protein